MFMPNHKDFKILSDRYRASAESLLNAKLFDAAYYLAGYSVECLLKAIICKRLGPNEYPPPNVNSTHYTHLVKKLTETAGIEKDLEYEKERCSELRNSYMVLKDWDPKTLRYESSPLGEKKAINYIDEIKNKKGFFKWLNKYL